MDATTLQRSPRHCSCVISPATCYVLVSRVLCIGATFPRSCPLGGDYQQGLHSFQKEVPELMSGVKARWTSLPRTPSLTGLLGGMSLQDWRRGWPAEDFSLHRAPRVGLRPETTCAKGIGSGRGAPGSELRENPLQDNNARSSHLRCPSVSAAHTSDVLIKMLLKEANQLTNSF